MPRMYGGVLWCHNCSTAPDQGPDGALVESQQHLEICKAYLHLHQGRDVENDFRDKVNFFMEDGRDGGEDQEQVTLKF